MHGKLDTKASGFVLKTKYETDKAVLENKISHVTDLVKKTKLINAVENGIPNVSSLIKKTNHDKKVSKLEDKLTDHNHDKNIITPDFNTLAGNIFNARLAQANLITKTDFDAKLSSLNRKITSNKTKQVLVENKFKKLKVIWFELFHRKKSILMKMVHNMI